LGSSLVFSVIVLTTVYFIEQKESTLFTVCVEMLKLCDWGRG